MDFISAPGASNAVSYVSLSAAASYFASRPGIGNAWTSATTATRQAVLMQAARLIDTGHFISRKAAEIQSLQFPRSGQEDPFEIPAEVQQAACEEALAILRKKPARGEGSFGQLFSPEAADLLRRWAVKRFSFGR